MVKLTYRKYIQNSLKIEPQSQLQGFYNGFLPLNVVGSALICESQCTMEIQNNDINGLTINNPNGLINIKPGLNSINNTETFDLGVSGKVQSDLNSSLNNEIYKLYKIIFFPIPFLKINNGHSDAEMHIIFKEVTDKNDPKFQINVVLLNQTNIIPDSNNIHKYQTYKFFEDISNILNNSALSISKTIKSAQSFKWSVNDLLPAEQSYFSFISPNNNKFLIILYEHNIEIPDVFYNILKQSTNLIGPQNELLDTWKNDSKLYVSIEKIPNIALFYTYNVDQNIREINENLNNNNSSFKNIVSETIEENNSNESMPSYKYLIKDIENNNYSEEEENEGLCLDNSGNPIKRGDPNLQLGLEPEDEDLIPQNEFDKITNQGGFFNKINDSTLYKWLTRIVLGIIIVIYYSVVFNNPKKENMTNYSWIYLLHCFGMIDIKYNSYPNRDTIPYTYNYIGWFTSSFLLIIYLILMILFLVIVAEGALKKPISFIYYTIVIIITIINLTQKDLYLGYTINNSKKNDNDWTNTSFKFLFTNDTITDNFKTTKNSNDFLPFKITCFGNDYLSLLKDYTKNIIKYFDIIDTNVYSLEQNDNQKFKDFQNGFYDKNKNEIKDIFDNLDSYQKTNNHIILESDEDNNDEYIYKYKLFLNLLFDPKNVFKIIPKRYNCFATKAYDFTQNYAEKTKFKIFICVCTIIAIGVIIGLIMWGFHDIIFKNLFYKNSVAREVIYWCVSALIIILILFGPLDYIMPKNSSNNSNNINNNNNTNNSSDYEELSNSIIDKAKNYYISKLDTLINESNKKFYNEKPENKKNIKNYLLNNQYIENKLKNFVQYSFIDLIFKDNYIYDNDIDNIDKHDINNKSFYNYIYIKDDKDITKTIKSKFLYNIYDKLNNIDNPTKKLLYFSLSNDSSDNKISDLDCIGSKQISNNYLKEYLDKSQKKDPTAHNIKINSDQRFKNVKISDLIGINKNKFVNTKLFNDFYNINQTPEKNNINLKSLYNLIKKYFIIQCIKDNLNVNKPFNEFMEEFIQDTNIEISKFIKEKDKLTQNLRPVDITATYNISDSNYDKILENTFKKPTSGGYKNKKKKKNKLTSDIIIDLLKN